MEDLSLPDELHLLEKNYTAVAMIVIAILKEKHIPPSNLYQYVSHLPQYLLQPKYKKLIERTAKLLQNAKTIDEFFAILSPYCDFLNPDLMGEIAEKFADELTSQLVVTYAKTLREFRRRTKIRSITNCWVAMTPPGYVEIELELSSKWNYKNLEYLESFRSYPSRMKWFFKKSQNGEEGLKVVFSVPKGVWLYQEDLDNLKKFSVLRVKEGERYIVRLDKIKEELMQSNMERLRHCTSDHNLHRTSYNADLARSASVNQLDRVTTHTGFYLHDKIKFGFHRQAGINVFISKSSLQAVTVDKHQGASLVYAAIPFRGAVEFEVRLVDYYYGIRGSIRMGVMQREICRSTSQVGIPKQSEHRDNSCVWFRSSFKHRTEFQNNFGSIHLLRYYGRTDLGELQKGDKIGLQVMPNGELSFFVNGMNQGVAAEEIYREDCDLFCFIEMVEGCEAIEVTRANMQDTL